MGRNNGGLEHWRSFEQDPVSSDQDSHVPKFTVDPEVPLETMVTLDDQESTTSEDGGSKNVTGLIIGDDLVRAKEPGVMDEMQRKKERIMMQSLRRKQQAEENRLRKLEEERQKREEEAKVEEAKMRKIGRARLNSSHITISYAVFCLKKKKQTTNKKQTKKKQ